MSRRNTTEALRRASISYLVDKGFSSHIELGLCRRGRLRADVIAVNLKGTVVLLEVKSCMADYISDSKWAKYLRYSNKMYFVFSSATYTKLKARLLLDLKNTGVGVLVLCETSGFLKAKTPAKSRAMAVSDTTAIAVRMAWRSGESKRNTERTPVFIGD